ncbi:MAG: FecR domain-containing protein, partial [Planctomycetota bacterium]
MGFLEDFDRRREAAERGRKRGDPPPEGESPEHRELLEFADLVREKLEGDPVGDAEGAKARLVARLRAAELAGERAARLRRRLIWIGSAAAAAACLLVALVLGMRKEREGQPGPETPEIGEVARTGRPKRPITPGPVDTFADTTFPKIKRSEATGAREVEVPFEKDRARLVRLRGLVLLKRADRRKSGPPWRLLRRGATLSPGDAVRASRRLGSGAILKGPEGSRVMLRAGGRVGYVGPRGWRLDEGTARFDVATGEGLAEFVVETPHGKLVAKGTRFIASVQKGATECVVTAGKVVGRSRSGEEAELSASRFELLGMTDARAVVESGRMRPGLTRETPHIAWMKALESDRADDHGIGELLARAEGDKTADMLPLEIESHKVTVTVVHPVARTFIDEVFVNNTDRRMEGVFYYTLPPDAAVSEFA